MSNLILPAPPEYKPVYRGCLVASYNGTFNIPNNATTAVTFFSAAEVLDTDGVYDYATSTSRFVIPVGVSKVRFYYGVEWASVASAYYRSHGLIRNGSTQFEKIGHASSQGMYQQDYLGGGHVRQNPSPIVEVTAGDYWELGAWQNSGANKTISRPFLEMEIIE